MRPKITDLNINLNQKRMKTLKFFSCALAIVALLASCKEKENGTDTIPEATFEIELDLVDNQLFMHVSPSSSDAVYTAGIIMEDDYAAMGGSDNLVSYIEDLVNSEGGLLSGNWSEEFSDLFWQTKYYAYAAQINEGAVMGTPMVMDIMVYRPFVEFSPRGAIIAPQAISDNGLWVVGCSVEESFIYDVRRDSITLVPNLQFYDVTDDGVVFGCGNPYPVIYENGSAKDITSVPEGATESCFFSVTPDGMTAVGYSMIDGNNMRPIIYENGTLSVLPYDLDPSGAEATMATASRIGSNGYITGYILDNTYMEVGCAWTPEYEYDLYTADLMEWNDGFYFWENIYGGLENYISPNGKYITSWRTNTGEDGWASDMYAYVFDTDTREIYNSPEISYRPDAVSSQGLLFLADQTMGFSTQPYVYDIHTDTFSTLADYAKSTWNYSPEGLTMQGSVMGTSEDGKSILVGFAADETYKTAIYFLPR